MGLKEWMQKRIEKDAVVSYLDGRKVILKKSAGIFEFLPSECLREKFREWSEIHPPIDENGNWNKINLIFGSWRNFVIILLILALVGLFLSQYLTAVSVIKKLQEVCICPRGIKIVPIK